MRDEIYVFTLDEDVMDWLMGFGFLFGEGVCVIYI
jgi:hypothetical protein